jgi:hypothetical protein
MFMCSTPARNCSCRPARRDGQPRGGGLLLPEPARDHLPGGHRPGRRQPLPVRARQHREQVSWVHHATRPGQSRQAGAAATAKARLLTPLEPIGCRPGATPWSSARGGRHARGHRPGGQGNPGGLVEKTRSWAAAWPGSAAGPHRGTRPGGARPGDPGPAKPGQHRHAGPGDGLRRLRGQFHPDHLQGSRRGRPVRMRHPGVSSRQGGPGPASPGDGRSPWKPGWSVLATGFASYVPRSRNTASAAIPG